MTQIVIHQLSLRRYCRHRHSFLIENHRQSDCSTLHHKENQKSPHYLYSVYIRRRKNLEFARFDFQ